MFLGIGMVASFTVEFIITRLGKIAKYIFNQYYRLWFLRGEEMLIKNTNATATNRRELIYSLYQKKVEEGNTYSKLFEVNSAIVLECMNILNHHNDLSDSQRQEQLQELVKNLKLDKLINLDILF
jgi:hypothetical protein